MISWLRWAFMGKVASISPFEAVKADSLHFVTFTPMSSLDENHAFESDSLSASPIESHATQEIVVTLPQTDGEMRDDEDEQMDTASPCEHSPTLVKTDEVNDGANTDDSNDNAAGDDGSIAESGEPVNQASHGESLQMDAVLVQENPFETSGSIESQEAVDGWVKQAMSLDEGSALADRLAFEKWSAELCYWKRRFEDLNQGLQHITSQFGAALEAAEATRTQLTQEVQAQLEGQHKGLELIHKMAYTRASRLADMRVPLVDPEALPTISQAQWRADLEAIADANAAELLISQKIKAIENERYRVLSESRNLCESRRKELIAFITRQILPILDGLDDGKKNSVTVVEQSHNSDSSAGHEAVLSWYQTFDTMKGELLGVLRQVGVQPMIIDQNTPIDYEKHEPFDIVADPTRQTEDIHEVVRAGYEYAAFDGSTQLLRAAQIVVVKN